MNTGDYHSVQDLNHKSKSYGYTNGGYSNYSNTGALNNKCATDFDCGVGNICYNNMCSSPSVLPTIDINSANVPLGGACYFSSQCATGADCNQYMCATSSDYTNYIANTTGTSVLSMINNTIKDLFVKKEKFVYKKRIN